MPHLLWHWGLSFSGLVRRTAPFCRLKGMWRTYSNPDPHECKEMVTEQKVVQWIFTVPTATMDWIYMYYTRNRIQEKIWDGILLHYYKYKSLTVLDCLGTILTFRDSMYQYIPNNKAVSEHKSNLPGHILHSKIHVSHTVSILLAGIYCWMNVESTLNRYLNVTSTLFQYFVLAGPSVNCR
jgi:hypothetical protein